MEEVLRRMRARGLRLTPQRRRLIEALAAVGRPASAVEVRARLEAADGRPSVDTVYRNLRLLVAGGLVHEIRGAAGHGSRFELAADHHHHLVCLSCGQVVCVACCPAEAPLARAVLAEAAGHSFTVTGHFFEVYGQCSACQVSRGKPGAAARPKGGPAGRGR